MIMNVSETSDVRELSAGELDAVSGAMPFLAAVWVVFSAATGAALAMGIGSTGSDFGGGGSTRDFNEVISEMPLII
jgi:hypothetical protein